MKKKEDVFFILYSPQVGSFKGGMSLTLVTFLFETSKLWACIIYALEGLECQGQYRAFAGYRDQWEP